MSLKPPGTPLQTLLTDLDRSFNETSFYPFIRYIRFPRYKNLRGDSRLTLTYPITVLLGKNGTNKSSILQAIYGVPRGYSTGHYWFSTDLDPITATTEGQPRFIYSYYIPKLSINVEVLNTRSGQSKGADYWEPARPRLADAMQSMPALTKEQKPFRSTTRWNSISKEVIFLDYRSEISAYDRAFNYLERRPTKLIKTAQDFIRRRSRHLLEVIRNSSKSYQLNGKEQIISHIELGTIEVQWASYVIGKHYDEVSIIEHTLFDSRAISVYLKSSTSTYSEALAGSGETAVCSLIHKISQAKEGSLVLLDEPEVSLHPGAQRRFIEYLLMVTKYKKHQIIISTHSAELIENLPEKALRLAKIGIDGKVDILEGVKHEEVFFEIEHTTNKPRIVCEDKTMKEVLSRLRRSNLEHITNYVDIEYYPGGADTIKSYYIPVAFRTNDKCFFIIDGDKKSGEMPDPTHIPPALDSQLKDMIDEAMGLKVQMLFNSNESNDDKNVVYKKFMAYYNSHVTYFPHLNPERMIIDEVLSKDPKYASCLGIVNVKDVIYECAKIYYNSDKVNNVEVEAFIKFCVGQIPDISEFLKSLVDFFELNIIGAPNEH